MSEKIEFRSLGLPPLNDAERAIALCRAAGEQVAGETELIKAVDVYLRLVTWSQSKDQSEAEKVAAVTALCQACRPIEPLVALELLRLCEDAKRANWGLPKPSPSVEAGAAALAESSFKTAGLESAELRRGGIRMTAQEQVMSRAVEDAVRGGMAMQGDEYRELFESERQRRKAKKPRQSRRLGLRLRGVLSVVRDGATSPEQVIDRIEADGVLTFDDDDVELRIEDESIVVEDLATGATESIPRKQLRSYVDRAKRHT